MRRWFRYQSLLTFSLLSLLCAMTLPGIARDWNPSPQDKARGYLQIKHQKSPREIVVAFWAAPEGLVPISEEMSNVLREHLIIVVVHMTTTATGELTPRPRGAVVVKDTSGATRQPRAMDMLPYNVTFALNNLGLIFSQLGALGKGAQFYVFEPKGTDSCKDGLFWVVYEGEEYEYRTPIPGCQ